MADAAGPAADILPPRFADWFAKRGWSPRAHQLAMVERAQAGRDALLIAPTGGGKTLAGFLPSLIALSERPPANSPRGLHTLYISPLKALAVDVERNLNAPILQMSLPIVAESRTGDTGISRRQRQRVKPPDILLTTPEQLALLCAWEGARLYFESLECVILDEIHTLHASKRGDLLALDLARVQQFAPKLRRVGLSATVDDPEVIKAWMANHRADGGGSSASVDLVRGPAGAEPIVEVLLSEGRVPWAGHTAQHAMAEVYEVIKRSRTALVFVNTRFQAEFAFQELWRLNEDSLPIALHHGSLAAEQRRKVEAAMARGELRAVVCTSTLDLGIDWGDVDLVIQLASPKGASRMVQRIGRANHRLDEPSRAIFVPANRFEMLECQAAREAIAENKLDGDPPRVGALDVLAQHVMGCACSEPFDLLALYDEVRSAGPYRDLAWEDFEQVVDFVSTGGYALKTYDRFRRIVKGQDGLWRVRNPETAQRHRLNVGAIVSPAMLSVRIAMRGNRGGRKIGEVEEGMLEMLEPGETFVFAGQVWRLVAVTNLDVLVQPAPAADPKMPSWGGSKFALSTYLAQRVRQLMTDQAHWQVLPTDVREWLEAQRDRSAIPGEDEMLLETFPRGKRHFMVVYPFEGRLAHTTLAMLLTRRLERLGAAPLGFVCNDYAMAIWALTPLDGLDFGELFDEDMLGDDLEAWLAESFMMKRAFKGCAIIAGLIERRFPGEQQKSGRQITFSTDLIYDVLRRHQPDHLLLRCARDDAATGLINVARLGQMLARIKGKIRHAPLEHLSPFSVPILLEIGKERAPGHAGETMILKEAEEDLIAEALQMNDVAPQTFAYAFTASPCGGLRTRLMAAEVMLRASGALWLEAERALVVADLHLEKGSSYAARGQMLPPYDTRETLRRLAAEVEALAPAVVILLGDTFHDRRSEERLAADDAERLRDLARGRTLVWVVGNHDADGPRDLPGETADELRMLGLTLRHEPQAGLQPGEVAGHLHPAAKVRVKSGGVRRRCFVTDSERAILPAFGAYAGGLNVRDKAFAGLFARSPLAGALGVGRVHAVGWRSLAED